MIASQAFWQLVEARAAATPDALFAVDERDRSLTFADYRAAALRAAAGLHARGISTGTPVSWMLPTQDKLSATDGTAPPAAASAQGIGTPLPPGMRITVRARVGVSSGSQHSTVLPATVQALAEQAAKQGVNLVDAAVTGVRSLRGQAAGSRART